MGFLASFLTGPILGAIFQPFISGLLDGYKAKLGAENSRDAQAVDLAKKEIEAEIAARAEGTKMMIAENGRWWTAMPRALVCWSFALFVSKVVVWDTMLGWGVTPALGGDVAQWSGMVMMTWFGGRSLEKIAAVFGRRK